MSVKHVIYQYIPVHTRMYHNNPCFHSNQAGATLRFCFVSTAFLCRSSATSLLLAIVCSAVRPPKRGFPRPNCHSHWLTSYTLLPCLPSTAAESAQPDGKPESLRLLSSLCQAQPVYQPCRENPTRPAGSCQSTQPALWATSTGLGALSCRCILIISDRM